MDLSLTIQQHFSKSLFCFAVSSLSKMKLCEATLARLWIFQIFGFEHIHNHLFYLDTLERVGESEIIRI